LNIQETDIKKQAEGKGSGLNAEFNAVPNSFKPVS
jgi:hypothetical protein